MSVTAPSRPVRTSLRPRLDQDGCSGSLKRVQRASSSLTQINTPKSTVALLQDDALGTIADRSGLETIIQ